jgi:mRNA guanylyltransferase
MKGLGKPLDDVVVECYLEVLPATNGHAANGNGKPAKRWRFYRFRDDKENGNFHTIVQSVMESIEDHVTEEDLLDAAPDIRTAWKNRASHEAKMKK